jgi:hypothetical protein
MSKIFRDRSKTSAMSRYTILHDLVRGAHVKLVKQAGTQNVSDSLTVVLEIKGKLITTKIINN